MHSIWGQFVKVGVAHLLAVASPGPDFAMVVRQSIVHGRKVAVWTSIGIGSAILVHVTYTILGMRLVMDGSTLAFTVVKFMGASYLAWLGFKGLTSRITVQENTPDADGRPRGAEKEPGPRKAWIGGFLTNALNPKVTLFMAALYATVIDPATPRLYQAAFGLWMSLATMAWFTAMSFLMTHAPIRMRFMRSRIWIDRAMGAVFIALAAALALASVGQR